MVPQDAPFPSLPTQVLRGGRGLGHPLRPGTLGTFGLKQQAGWNGALMKGCPY